jgi:GNAT superfamily N-acetyltransferase
MVTVEPLRPDDWKTTRDLRLRSLLDAPGAFGGTYEETAKREEADWRGWPNDGQPFAAWLAGKPVGLVCAWLDPRNPRVTTLIAMWVEPAARGGQAAPKLIDAVVEWARANGCEAVELVVYDTNQRARRTYEKYGFHAEGPSEQWPGQAMRLALS